MRTISVMQAPQCPAGVVKVYTYNNTVPGQGPHYYPCIFIRSLARSLYNASPQCPAGIVKVHTYNYIRICTGPGPCIVQAPQCPAGILKPAFPLSHTILRFVPDASCMPRFQVVFTKQPGFCFCIVMHISLYHYINLYVYLVGCACSVLTPNARVQCCAWAALPSWPVLYW
jgi:hypothetical protein